jgi:hypothetical protein
MVKARCLPDFMDMQKNNVFCSICTVNYSAYAGTLNDSLRKVGHNEPHYVLLADYDVKYNEVIERFGFKPVFLNELNIPATDELIEKYSPFELSNVLKPFFMEWLIKNHPEIDNLVYLDTDIYVYNSLHEIFNYLDENQNTSVVLTPHLKEYESCNKTSDYNMEILIMKAGLYNGGFYALKNDQNSLQFLEWHKRKMLKHGYNAPNAYMFVDQKILDFAPILFEYVGIYRNESYNVAHWNYYERPIEFKDDAYFIKDKKLTFFHFSQLKIDTQDLAKSLLFKISIQGEPILQKMVLDYWACLKEHGYEEIINIPYSFEGKYKEPPLSLIDPLLAKEKELGLTKNRLESIKAELGLNKIKLDLNQSQLESTNTELSSVKIELGLAKSQLNSAKTELNSIKKELNSNEVELNSMYCSREWKAAMILRKIVKIIFPNGSSRRKIAVIIWRNTKFFLRLFLKVAIKIKSKTLLYSNFFYAFIKPKKHRKINTKSKKIAFVDHSYHSKTKSNDFIIDYLKQFFEVEEILDESWLKNKPFPNLSFINRDYLAVIFWQNLPPRGIYKKIKNNNIVFFPMYDAVGELDYSFWNSYPNLKIVSFSKSLHDKLARWGLNSMHIQYFPKPHEFTPGKKNEAFFWQRLTKININTISEYFSGENIKIHIHKAIDPNHRFIEPSQKVEEKFQITYSDWFKTRDEMWSLIKQKGIYIASREFEGIGLSFLEAMAMGKAVVAVNNPTMSEYIEHNKTGYLFDLSKPKKIDLSNIGQVVENTHNFMRKGHVEWEKNKHRIIDFIRM